MNQSFLNDDKTIIEESMNTVAQTTEQNSQYFLSISDNLVRSYTESLDTLMKDLYTDCVTNTPSDVTLEKYMLELNNMLYFMGTNLENVGIKDDLSKLAAKEVYNSAYLENIYAANASKTKVTVAENQAHAEEESKYETIMNNIYSRVYKQIKFKVDAGYEMMGTLKKIMNRRMQDAALTMSYNNNDVPKTGSEEVY